MIFLIFFLLVGIVVNVLMVWGVMIEFCWLLWPWLAFHLVTSVVYFVAPIFAIYHADYESFILAAETERWKVFLALIPIGWGLVSIYFWIVISK